MSYAKKLIATLDGWFPPCGPCWVCGHEDKRHRLWDAIIGCVEAGDSVESTAHNYDLSIEAVEAVLAVRPYKRSKMVATR